MSLEGKITLQKSLFPHTLIQFFKFVSFSKGMNVIEQIKISVINIIDVVSLNNAHSFFYCKIMP